MKRICYFITGPICSGKTTIAQFLAETVIDNISIKDEESAKDKLYAILDACANGPVALTFGEGVDVSCLETALLEDSNDWEFVRIVTRKFDAENKSKIFCL